MNQHHLQKFSENAAIHEIAETALQVDGQTDYCMMWKQDSL